MKMKNKTVKMQKEKKTHGDTTIDIKTGFLLHGVNEFV